MGFPGYRQTTPGYWIKFTLEFLYATIISGTHSYSTGGGTFYV
jgi:hypothetical protein